MSGQRNFHQKCVCGAEIQVGDAYSFLPHPDTHQLINDWQNLHADCVPLFQEVQKARMGRLVRSHNGQLLLSNGDAK